MTRIIFAVLALTTGLEVANAAPVSEDHYTKIRAYVIVFTAAATAEQVCPNLKMNTSAILMVRVNAKIRENEEPLVDDEIDRTKKSVFDAVQKDGRLSWCQKAWRLFGKNGSMLPNVITQDQ